MSGGREPLPASQRRSYWISFRVTEGEKDAVCRGALQSGCSEGDYVMVRLGFRVTETSEAFLADGPSANLVGSR